MEPGLCSYLGPGPPPFLSLALGKALAESMTVVSGKVLRGYLCSVLVVPGIEPGVASCKGRAVILFFLLLSSLSSPAAASRPLPPQVLHPSGKRQVYLVPSWAHPDSPLPAPPHPPPFHISEHMSHRSCRGPNSASPSVSASPSPQEKVSGMRRQLLHLA